MLITLPGSFEEAMVKLNQKRLLSEFATVRSWERAAMVAMMVDNSGRGRPRNDAPYKEKYSVYEFARLRLYCLKSPQTISANLLMWDSLGLPRPKPGDTVEIPVMDPREVKSSFERQK